MSNYSEQKEIEDLQTLLKSSEALARDTRKKLIRLLSDKESRRCDAEILWDEKENMYVTKFSRDNKILSIEKIKKYYRQRASIGIEDVGGKPPRVPWKQIDNGTPWAVSVILSDWFWEKYIDKADMPEAKVISIETFRILNQKH